VQECYSTTDHPSISPFPYIGAPNTNLIHIQPPFLIAEKFFTVLFVSWTNKNNIYLVSGFPFFAIAFFCLHQVS
jgi:hypothetical protein